MWLVLVQGIQEKGVGGTVSNGFSLWSNKSEKREEGEQIEQRRRALGIGRRRGLRLTCTRRRIGWLELRKRWCFIEEKLRRELRLSGKWMNIKPFKTLFLLITLPLLLPFLRQVYLILLLIEYLSFIIIN